MQIKRCNIYAWFIFSRSFETNFLILHILSFAKEKQVEQENPAVEAMGWAAK